MVIHSESSLPSGRPFRSRLTEELFNSVQLTRRCLKQLDKRLTIALFESQQAGIDLKLGLLAIRLH